MSYIRRVFFLLFSPSFHLIPNCPNNNICSFALENAPEFITTSKSSPTEEFTENR